MTQDHNRRENSSLPHNERYITIDSPLHDLLIIGGGINGTGIAADAAARGLNVVLCEKNDLGSATSSASTKMIHGGLRYLEQYEFRLVREALNEREVLLRNAPHIIWPLRLQLPHRPHLRPRWMIRAGLFLYDFLGHRVSLPRSRALSFPADSPLLPELAQGFEYSDAWVDDSRLVILNAMQARECGAVILPRHECVAVSLQTQADECAWQVTLLDNNTGSQRTLKAKTIVNAAGPWVGRVAQNLLPHTAEHSVRLVKGCHIIVPRLYEQSEAFLLQNNDGRVVFVIPYEQDFTLIGTTEEEYSADPGQAGISSWEIDYLLQVVNSCFRNKLSATDIVHHFAGVRPLLEDEETNASKVSRDYTLELDVQQAPVLTVYGGKITTYRKLAEAALDKLQNVLPPMADGNTAQQSLPGGDFVSHEQLQQQLRTQYPWLPDELRMRWTRQYGTLAFTIAGAAQSVADLGTDFGHDLYAREVDYLCTREWALTAEDILWRRTKLGLRFTTEQCANLTAYLKTRE